jgi:3'(2'), 5'-bisphosphate nucleotidase
VTVDRGKTLEHVLAVAREAGEGIARIYAGKFDVEYKGPNDPVTRADREANTFICAELARAYPGMPIVAEESDPASYAGFGKSPQAWFVDPLDGTREFVKKNGEFTVNIALIDNGSSVLGVVYAPALDYMVHAERGVGAFVRDGATDIALLTQQPAPTPLRVAASRSHLDARTAAALEKMGATERIGMGSSLKFCRIAEGRIDVYPRFGPTSEWDTAAAQCVLEAAGGVVLTLDGMALRYNTKESLLNPDFIALGDSKLGWRGWLDD